MPEYRAETQAAIEAVRAGLEIVQGRLGADEVTFKGPRDIVTGTDLRAQAAIKDVLARHFAGIPFVGEEGPDQRVPEAGSYWLVDPLCGTSNFAADLPLVAINVALIEDGHVTVGVVADGTTGDVYIGQKGAGAWRGDQRLRVNPDARAMSLDPILEGPGKLKNFGTEFAIRILAEQRHGVRVFASTLALEYLARGSLAASVYQNNGIPVHFAAGLLLAEEAGAIVTDENGNPWQLFGPIYVAAASPTLHAELAGIAQRVVETLLLS
jgi:myo-inositol-1(or 4)-monophosphatase